MYHRVRHAYSNGAVRLQPGQRLDLDHHEAEALLTDSPGVVDPLTAEADAQVRQDLADRMGTPVPADLGQTAAPAPAEAMHTGDGNGVVPR